MFFCDTTSPPPPPASAGRLRPSARSGVHGRRPSEGRVRVRAGLSPRGGVSALLRGRVRVRAGRERRGGRCGPDRG